MIPTPPNAREHSEPAADAGVHAGPNPLLIAHRLLRGRYLLAAGLGLLLALPAAIAGYVSIPKSYISRAIVQVNPEITPVVYDQREFARMPEFEAFVSAQATLLSSQRVVRFASENQRLRDAGWPAGSEGAVRLENSLKVILPRRATSIIVEVSDPDPRLAESAVNAVLDAYIELNGEQLGLRMSERQSALTELVQQLTRELSTTRESIFQLSDEYGADTLAPRHGSRLEELQKYDALISQLELALVDAEAKRTGGAVVTELPPLSTEELASKDTLLAQLLTTRSEIDARYATLSERYGPNHREMRELTRRMAEVESLIERRVQIVMRQHQADPAALGGAQITADNIESAKQRLEQLRQLRSRTNDEVRELGRRMRLIQSLTERTEATKQRLDDASRQLENLRVESASMRERSGRVVIAQRGELPFAPSSDKRIMFAAAGGAAGLAVGVGLIGLFGFLRPTCRYIDEVESTAGFAALLGTLPDFSREDTEGRDMAALSVHHIRNAILSALGHSKSSVLTVTSPSSGDGKTSLTMALGTSFAASGHRTLLVDADFVGRGLTRELRIGDAEGLPEAILSGSVDGLVKPTAVPRLFVLSAGRHAAVDPTKLSRSSVAPIIDALRKQYTSVLIDTGPIMGSLEAAIVVPLSDRVIMTVSRGQNARLVRAALERLQRFGGMCAGIVFNRATPLDFRHSVSHASIRSQSYAPRHSDEPARATGSARASLMDAVAGVSPHLEPDDTP